MIPRSALPLALLIVYLWPAAAAAQLVFTAAPPTGLIGSYDMSTTTDSSGNGRTATFTNTATVPGKYGSAQRFNGTNARMTIPSVNVTTAFTVEAWVFLGSVAATRVLAQPRDGASTWEAIVYRGPDQVFLAEVGGFITAGFTPVTGPPVQVVNPSKTTPNAWHHIAATYDGAGVSIYVDGVQTARAAATGAIAPSTQPWEVGGSAVDLGYLTGVIDDVRIYSRALPLADITADMGTAVDTQREPVLSWDVDVWPKGSTPATGPITASTNILRSAAACNLAPLPAPVGSVVNPTKARSTDPDNGARECELIIQQFIAALPVGSGYTATLRARGATTASDRSGPSNAFDRVAEALPPLPAGTPTVR